MSTFSSGDQLVEIVSIDGLYVSNNLSHYTMYTIPAGHYGLVKWAFANWQIYNYEAGSQYGHIYAQGPHNVLTGPSYSITLAGSLTGVDQGLNYTWEDAKRLYMPVINSKALQSTLTETKLDVYLGPLTAVKFYTAITSASYHRGELTIHVYKHP